MPNKLSKISKISIINKHIYSNFANIEYLEYEDTPIGSGGFGTIYRTFNPKYVIKIFHDKTAQKHAYETISLLHHKIKIYPKETGAYILQDFPELLGLPFAAFEAFNSEKQEIATVLLMHNLAEEGFIDFGGDERETVRLKQLDLESKLILCYQLSKIIAFLHDIKFIHSDLSDNSIWIDPANTQIALIDYDSGYHYDKQKAPTTIGKITHWVDSNLKKLFNSNPTKNTANKRKNLTTSDRLNSENWILANAIFEIIFNVSPYFFLIDADDQTKINYSNSYDWPEIEKSSSLFQKHNEVFYNKIKINLQLFSKIGLNTLINSFKKVFGKGYDNPKARLTSKDWKNILYTVCIQLKDKTPSISHYTSNKTHIYSNKEEVVFEWDGSKYNKAYLNNKLVAYKTQQISMNFLDSKEVTLRLVNDFGEDTQVLEIIAVKVAPKILTFDADKYVRNDVAPIILSWETNETDYVVISGIDSQHLSIGTTEVKPIDHTIYTLTAVGHFGQKVYKELSLDVIYPEILEFSWEINLHKGLNNVDIKWETEHAEKVLLEPLAGEREANGLEHISISGELKFTLTAIGLYKSVTKDLLAEPMGLPKIRQINAPMPNFQITNLVNTDHLKLPPSLTTLSEIRFSNQLLINKSELSNDKMLEELKQIDFTTSDEIDISSFNTTSNIMKRTVGTIKKLMKKLKPKSKP